MTRASTLGVLIAVLTSACTSTPQLLRVNVAVPVACSEVVPDRPAMPTEALRAGVDLHTFTKAATAELERREGYEGRLRAALISCTTPVEEPDRPR